MCDNIADIPEASSMTQLLVEQPSVDDYLGKFDEVETMHRQMGKRLHQLQYAQHDQERISLLTQYAFDAHILLNVMHDLMIDMNNYFGQKSG